MPCNQSRSIDPNNELETGRTTDQDGGWDEVGEVLELYMTLAQSANLCCIKGFGGIVSNVLTVGEGHGHNLITMVRDCKGFVYRSLNIPPVDRSDP